MRNYENSIHVLLKCPNVVQVWRDVNLWDKIDRILRQNYNMDAVVFTLLHQLSPSQSELFATDLRSLWKRKNLKFCQQKNETNMEVVERATHLPEDWRSAQIIRSGCGVPVNINRLDLNSQETIRWEKPVLERYKCNIKASFSSAMNKVVIGMCICGDAGDFVIVKTF